MRNRTLPALASIAALFGLAGAGLANPLAYSNDTGGSALAYGQISPAYVLFDDGEESYGNLVDNAHSNTRVGLFLDQEFGDGGLLRFNFETALGAPASNDFSQDFEPVWIWDKGRLRKIEISFEESWGRLWIGQGNMASEGASSANLSRVTIVSSRAVGDNAGGYVFRHSDGTLSDLKIKDTHRKWDGSRRLRLRYDTPEFWGQSDGKGVYFSVAYGKEVLDDDNDNTYYDIAARLEDRYADFTVKASIGYGWIDGDESTDEYWSGAFSTLHEPTGLNATIAGGADPDGGSFAYGMAGWIADFVDLGGTAFGVDYYSGTDTVYDGADASKWGIHVVQHFDDTRLQVYLGYDSYSFEDDTGASYQDASATTAGFHWKF